MKLTYRGVQYDYNPPTVDMQQVDEAGKFRGVDIRFRNVKKAPVQQPTLDLVYRGVAYQTGHSTDAIQPVVEPVSAATSAGAEVSTGDVEGKARTMLMNHHRVVKRRQQSMLGRLATEVGLPESAVHYWGHIQGKVHPSFWATYDRSHAASS